MNSFKWLIIMPLLLTILFTPSVMAISTPAGILYYESANMVSGNVMSANTQILITLNAGAIPSADWGAAGQNMEAFNGVSGTVLDSWIENSNVMTTNTLHVWIRNPDGGWRTDNNIYIGLVATSTNLFSKTGTTGQAPNLSASYGIYDNGNIIFNVYDNFMGSNLNTNLWTGESSGGGSAPVVNNGLTLSTAGGGQSYVWGNPTQYGSVNAFVLEGYQSISSNAMDYAGGASYSGSNLVSGGLGGASEGIITGSSGNWACYSSNGAGTNGQTSLGTALINKYYILSTYTDGSATTYCQLNYGTAVSQSATFAGSYYYAFGLQQDSTAQVLVANWFRIRVKPPSGIMPTTTFGPLIASITSITLTPNTITYAQSATAVAYCVPSTDTCDVDMPLGTHLCSGTGTCTYNIPAIAVGTYTFSANDLTNGFIGNAILTISKASITSYSLNNCSNEQWTIASGGYSCTTTGTYSFSANNLLATQQVVATLYLNNLPVATTSGSNTISNTITNSILTAAYTFNSPATSNFLAGNAIPISWVGYTPLYTQNSVTTITVNTLGNTISNGYIPYYLHTQSPSPSVTYGLSNAITLQSGVLNISYIVGNTFTTGTQDFTANEFQSGNPLSTVVTIAQDFTPLNSIVFNSAACTPGLTPASTPIQYFPLQFIALTQNCWNSIPSTYTIDGYTNSSANGIIATSGSNTLTEPINIRANYNMFSPPYSFNLTSNNGQSLNSVSLIAGCGNSFFEASNSAPAAPCTRVLLNISTYDQRTFGKLNTMTTSVLVGTFNGWTVSNQTSFTGNTYKIYIPTSSFQNPALTLTTTTLSSSATSHFPAINNYCPTTLTSAQSSWLRPYLVDLNGSLYTFNIYQGYSNAGNNDYMWVMDGVNNATAINVQQFRVTGTPFALALENGGLYSFRFYNPNCGIISASNYSIWSNPISLNLPQANNTQSPIKTANVTTSCVKSFLTTNTMAVTCTGTDTQNLVSSWKVTLYNISSISGWTASNTFNESTASFSQTLSPLSNFSPTQVTVVWFGQGFSGSQSFQFNQNGIQSGLSTAARGFIILLFLLVGLGLGVAGASTGAIEQVHAPSTTIFIEALIIALLFFTGLLGNATSPFIPNYIVIGILVLMMFVGIQSHHHESSGN